MINRRSFLQRSGAVAGLSAMGLSGCTRHVMAPVAPTVAAAPALPFYDAVGPIIPIRADMDRTSASPFVPGRFGPRVHGRMWSGSEIRLSFTTTATAGAACRYPGDQQMWWCARCWQKEARNAKWQ